MRKHDKYEVCEFDDYKYTFVEDEPIYSEEQRIQIRKKDIEAIDEIRKNYNLPLLTKEEKERIMNM